MTLKIANSNFFKNNMLTIFLIVVVAMVLMNDSVKEGMKNLTNDLSASGNKEDSKEAAGPGPSSNPKGPAPNENVISPRDTTALKYAKVNTTDNKVSMPPCAQFVSSNLLPKDDPKLDANFNEFSPAKDLEGQDFIDTNKYAIGMQSQSLRNANLQLRSDPPIGNTMDCPCPWNNSTIHSEVRRQLNIGSSV